MPTLLLDTVNVEEAVMAERSAPPGLLEVRFYVAEPVSDNKLQDIFDLVYHNGADIREAYQRKTDGLWYVGVKYFKHAETTIAALPIAIIPLIAFGMIVALIGIGIFKIEDIVNNLAKLLLIIFGGTIILAAITRKPLEAAAKKYIGG